MLRIYWQTLKIHFGDFCSKSLCVTASLNILLGKFSFSTMKLNFHFHQHQLHLLVIWKEIKTQLNNFPTVKQVFQIVILMFYGVLYIFDLAKRKLIGRSLTHAIAFRRWHCKFLSLTLKVIAHPTFVLEFTPTLICRINRQISVLVLLAFGEYNVCQYNAASNRECLSTLWSDIHTIITHSSTL